MTPLQVENDGDWQPLPQRRPIPKRDGGVAKVVVREQREVALAVAKADSILPVASLQKKLGKSAFRLWCVLLTLRDKKAQTHPSMAGLVRATQLTPVQVVKSLTRLRDFGLVVDHGFVYRKVPCRCPTDMGYHVHKVYLRTVRGALKESHDQQEIRALVPRETAGKVTQAAGHGGARKGAGRPKGSPNKKPSETGEKISSGNAYKYQELISSEEPTALPQKCGVSLRVNSSETENAGRRRKNPLQRFCPVIWGEVVPTLQPQAPAEEVSMSKPVQPKAPTPRSASAFPHAARPAPAVIEPLRVAAGDLDAEWASLFGDESATELSLGGAGAQRQRYTSEDMRAATELSSHIEYLRVPAPPKVSETHTDEERLTLLATAYRAAHEKVLRVEYWRPRKPQSAAERKALIEASHALTAECVSPHAWAMFSMYRWRQMGKEGSPSAKWVWSAVRIHEQASWCHEATGTQATNRAWPSPSMSEYIRRVGLIRSLLGHGRPTDEVVSQVLSETERRVLLARAAQEREAGRRDMERAIKAGEWVW